VFLLPRLHDVIRRAIIIWLKRAEDDIINIK
jgi:hypothetical protein